MSKLGDCVREMVTKVNMLAAAGDNQVLAPFWDPSDQASMSDKLKGTIIRIQADDDKVSYWWVAWDDKPINFTPVDPKIAVCKTGAANPVNVKLSDLQAAGEVSVIAGVLSKGALSGAAAANIKIAGFAASLTPEPGDQFTQLVLCTGGNAAAPRDVEDVLKSAQLAWAPWAGRSEAQALTPHGPDMVPLVEAMGS